MPCKEKKGLAISLKVRFHFKQIMDKALVSVPARTDNLELFFAPPLPPPPWPRVYTHTRVSNHPPTPSELNVSVIVLVTF